MTDHERAARVLGTEIAKVLDAESVKPPLRMQAWEEIHKHIKSALQDAADAAIADYEIG